MNNIMRVIFCIFFLCTSCLAQSATKQNNRELFQHIFSTWTTAFNNKDLTKSCQLFAKNVVADYQGFPRKNYHTICDGFKKVFSEDTKRYEYSFKLHEIYRSENLAAVRITWYLRLYEHNKLISSTKDEGIDIFNRTIDDKWQIVNYLSYMSS